MIMSMRRSLLHEELAPIEEDDFLERAAYADSGRRDESMGIA
jgi:hypothetical protein